MSARPELARRGGSRLELGAVAACVAVLGICLFYTHLQLKLPSRDVPWDPTSWRVIEDSTACIDDARCLRIGDLVLSVGGVSRRDFLSDRSRAIFDRPSPIAIEVRRGDSIDVVRWSWTERPFVRVVENLVTAAFPLLFWLVGTACAILVRPRDLRWLLLVGFFFDMAILLSAGFVSFTQQALSSYVTHAAAILVLPLSVHLHLMLPSRDYPRLETALPALWLASGAALVVDVFSPLSPAQMSFMVLGGLLVSTALLLGRLRRPQPAPVRAAHRLMIAGVALGIAPWLLLLTLFQALLHDALPIGSDHLFVVVLGGLMLPLWPLSYLWAIHKLDLGRLELRANRALGAYGFWSLYSICFVTVFFSLAGRTTLIEREPVFASLLVSLPFAVFASTLRRRFQGWVDRTIFGIRVPPRRIVQAFAARIPSALDLDTLRSTLVDELLPALLVRRSALTIVDGERVETLYRQDVGAAGLPRRNHELDRVVTALDAAHDVEPTSRVARLVRESAGGGAHHDLVPAWTRIVLPLVSDGRTLGLWFLGRRDPDDAYPRDDLEVFEQVANLIAAVLRARIHLLENERLQSQLVQSQKMEAIGRLSAGVAHDFNNLLSAILGYCDLLLPSRASTETLEPRARSGEPDELSDRQRDDYIEGIREAGEKAAALTTQLLAFSRQQVMASRVVDLNRVIRGLENLLQRVIAQGVAVRCELDPDAPPVCVDPGQMEQVLLNLVVNASDAMPEGGTLVLRTDAVDLLSRGDDSGAGLPPGRYTRLRVIDTGVGMDDELLEQIFEPFFTTKSLGQGTGLGLSMVYGIVRQSEGHIRVESSPGEGSTFSIFLPEAEADDEQPVTTVPRAAGTTHGDETILLVEDEPSVRRVVADMLRGRGYTILEAPDGPQALDLVAHHDGPLHLLLTDVILPTLKGPDLADRLVLRRPDLRVIFMSGYSEESLLGRRVAEDGAVLVRKPFTPQALASEIRDVLDGVPAGARAQGPGVDGAPPLFPSADAPSSDPSSAEAAGR